MMQRVLVIGHPGSGKSTLAKKLARILDLPLIHLDQQFWRPGWQATPSDEWRERVRDMVSGERWVIDGTFDQSLDIRLPRAETVIFLDFPRRMCVWRIIKRIMSGYGKVRSDMGAGCPERWDWSFIKFAWRYRRNQWPGILRALREHGMECNVIRLTSPVEVSTMMERLRDERI